MSSVARYATSAVKLPAGRKAKAQPDQPFLTCLDYEPYCFQKSDIDALVSSGFIKVSESLYIAKTEEDLSGALTALNNLDEYWFDSEEYTAVDLGKTIRIGIAGGDNDVITMRLVKRTGTVESLGGPVASDTTFGFPNVCYIVTGNRRGVDYNNALYCSVLGTTPNNRTKKPFLANGGYNPLVVTKETMASVLASTQKISETFYLARTISEFNDVLSSLDNSDNYTEMSSNELSSIDLGKTLRVGIIGGETDMLVFRLIKRTGNLASSGEPYDTPEVGYICVASKVNISDPEGAAEPAVMGTSPNALEIKPQFLNNGSYEPTLFPKADLESILADCDKVSDSLYLAKSNDQLGSVCTTLDNSSGRDYIQNDSMTTVDMGATIRLGLVGGETDLITFASTRGLTNDHPDELTTGYVVVASKISQTYNDALYVSILGSAPRNS